MKTMIQQAVSGFNTVAVISGPFTVRIHEALDASYQRTPHRYFISVDFKFKQADALNIGNLGYLGITKAEATREANRLAQTLTVKSEVVNRCEELVLNNDTFTNRHTLKLQREALDRIVGKYCAEFTN